MTHWPPLQAKIPQNWETVSPSSRQLKYFVWEPLRGQKGSFFHADQLSHSDLWPPIVAPANDSWLYVPEMSRGSRESVSPQEQVSMWKNLTTTIKNKLYVQFCLGQPHSGMKNQK